MGKLSFRDLDVRGKRVLVRVDYNVPLKDDAEGGKTITDDTRIRASLPTLRHLLDHDAKVILVSHLGRPKGAPNPDLSLAPVVDHLASLLACKVHFNGQTIGPEAEAAAAQLPEGEVLLLENVRFFPGEEANDPAFARQLANLADLYVNDAFGTAHRAHASTAGVTRHVSHAAMGALLERELQYLQNELDDPARPFLVILGGAKVSDKIQVITALMEKADVFLIGGAMAYTFRKAQGYPVGDSMVEDGCLNLARDILAKAEKNAVRFILPVNSLETNDFDSARETRQTPAYEDGQGVSEGWQGVDIGDLAIETFKDEIAKAKTIVWNGPVGVFEKEPFSHGTRAVAEALAANREAVTIIGGGDSVTAVNQFGLTDQMTFISTGGGASLELLEGRTLPGVAALTER